MDVDAFVEDVFPVGDSFLDGLQGGIAREGDSGGIQQHYSPFVLETTLLHIPNPFLLLGIIYWGLDLDELIDKSKGQSHFPPHVVISILSLRVLLVVAFF